MNTKNVGVGVIIPLLLVSLAVPIRKPSENEQRQHQPEEVMTKAVVLDTRTDTRATDYQIHRNHPQYL